MGRPIDDKALTYWLTSSHGVVDRIMGFIRSPILVSCADGMIRIMGSQSPKVASFLDTLFVIATLFFN